MGGTAQASDFTIIYYLSTTTTTPPGPCGPLVPQGEFQGSEQGTTFTYTEDTHRICGYSVVEAEHLDYPQPSYSGSPGGSYTCTITNTYSGP